MPWFKVDDTLAWHAKVVEAGNSAIGLWARAGSWSMQQLTDGYVPEEIARSLGSQGDIRRLVHASLWDRMDHGYQFHEWLDRQPSREQVLADRKAATERQKRARDAAKQKRVASNVTHLSQR